ncbi:MAG TPA: hypothetical protein VMO26_25445 [Vicinamibacterales bacterium]|nr:hypothetical protein [Vicinamibacterales bacterium]
MPTPLRFAVAPLALAAMTGCLGRAQRPIVDVPPDLWPAYAGAAGARYSALGQIAPSNVARLAIAWTYHAGERGEGARDAHKLTFEATPLHYDGRLYLATAYGRVIALEPRTGREVWRYDAGVDRGGRYSEVTSRASRRGATRERRLAPHVPRASSPAQSMRDRARSSFAWPGSATTITA